MLGKRIGSLPLLNFSKTSSENMGVNVSPEAKLKSLRCIWLKNVPYSYELASSSILVGVRAENEVEISIFALPSCPRLVVISTTP